MRGGSAAAIRSQTRRRNAGLRTTKRPDARVTKSSAWKKSRRTKKRRSSAVFQSPKRQSDYRSGAPDRASAGGSILIGAAIIAAAILLSTLITAVGTRFAGMEGSNDESMWLIDRLTGRVYKCQAPERGKASCEADIAAVGSIGERSKH